MNVECLLRDKHENKTKEQRGARQKTSTPEECNTNEL